MKRAIFAIIFLCLMAGYSEAGDHALGCFRLQDVQRIEQNMKDVKTLDLAPYLAENRCMLVEYDSFSIRAEYEQFRLVEYRIGSGSVSLWTAWVNGN